MKKSTPIPEAWQLAAFLTYLHIHRQYTQRHKPHWKLINRELEQNCYFSSQSICPYCPVDSSRTSLFVPSLKAPSNLQFLAQTSSPLSLCPACLDRNHHHLGWEFKRKKRREKMTIKPVWLKRGQDTGKKRWGLAKQKNFHLMLKKEKSDPL